MARMIELEPVRTYATEANAVRAVEKAKIADGVRYFLQRTPEGRFFPVFLGQAALQEMVHLKGFNVVG